MIRTLALLRQDNKRLRIFLLALERQVDAIEQAAAPDLEILGRIVEVVRQVQVRARINSENSDGQVQALEKDARRLQGEIDNLINAIACGTLEQDDVREQIGCRKSEIEDLRRRIAAKRTIPRVPVAGLTDQKIHAFGAATSSLLRSGGVKLRQAYLRLFINRIEVSDDEIRIAGSDDALPAAASTASSGASPNGVIAFAQEWRAKQDASANTWIGEGTFAR
jgi:site-specific DNA recombinase